MTIEVDRSFLRPVEPTHTVKHRGLSGPIRSDNRPNFPLAHVKTNIINGYRGAKTQLHVLNR